MSFEFRGWETRFAARQFNSSHFREDIASQCNLCCMSWSTFLSPAGLHCVLSRKKKKKSNVIVKQPKVLIFETIYGSRNALQDQKMMALWQSQTRTPVGACPWASSLPKLPKTAQRSRRRLKTRGGVCVCEVRVSLHYLYLDVARWKPSSRWRLTKQQLSPPRLATAHDGYRDVSNTHNGLGKAWGGWARASYSTLSSNHLILMLLHCLVNQPSIYINP